MKMRRFRPEILHPSDTSIRHIALTQDQITRVAACDYDWLMQWNWCAHWNPEKESFYAVRGEGKGPTFRLIHMHRFIMGMPRLIVDHRNGKGLDNFRSNLRLADDSESQANRRKQSNNKSGYKGVHLRGDTQQWVAAICYRGVHSKQQCPSALDAAVAYDLMAIEIHGEFASLNFPRENYRLGGIAPESP